MLAKNTREEYTYLPKNENIKPIKREKRVIKRKNNKFKFMSIILKSFIIFGASIIVLYSYTSVTELRIDIDKIQIKKNELINEKNYLNTNLEELKVKSKIEDKAILELGMDYPRQDQVVYVEVNNKNKREHIKEDNLFKSVIKSMIKIFRS